MDWDDTFRELKEEYILASDEKINLIARTLDQLVYNPSDGESLKDLMRCFHGFAGSGATYGFPKVTEIGSLGENRCNELTEASRSVGNDEIKEFLNLLDELRREFSKGKTEQREAATSRVEEIEEKPKKKALSLLVVSNDEETARTIVHLAGQEGISVFAVSTKAEAMEALECQLPDGMIADVRLPDGSGYELIERLRSLPGGDDPSVLLISPVSKFLDKVEAVRCGADGYFEKPVDWEALISRIGFLFARKKSEPARILSVEDDLNQSVFIKMALESVGYEVRICQDPKYFEFEMASFKPDLVLMDIMLPNVSGYDLAKYLRQNEAYATLPVVFLTTSQHLQSRIETAKAGGDDYLVKPVPPGLLLSTVAARIERARFLKSLLDRDGLTKLLTHTAFHERLKAAISAKKRNAQKTSALIMIDLDHFKRVNDTYGHPVGDRVLSSLSAMLRKRLRQSDSIGRYGGEEFAALVENLNEEEAVKLAERLLEEFSNIEHSAPNGSTFRVTFSAGAATLENEMDVESWKRAADDALYASKKAGRNRVTSASAKG